MIVTNYSGQSLYLNGVEIAETTVSIPNDKGFSLAVGSESIAYTTETNEILVTSTGTGISADLTDYPDNPVWVASLLMISALGVHIMVKILQKLRMS